MPVPEDRYWIVYFIFYVLGLGTLLPWNFYITANDYWMYKLRDNATTDVLKPTGPPSFNSTFENISDSEESSELQYNQLQSLFQNSLSICAQLPNVIFQFLNTLLQQKIEEKVRVLFSLVFTLVLFIFTEALVKIDTSSWQQTFFAISLVSIVLLNSCSAIFQSSVFGIAAGFPSQYTQAVMAGQGMGGTLTALAMIAAISFSSGPTSSAFAFFFIAIVVIVITGLCYMALYKNKFYTHFHKVKKVGEKSNSLLQETKNSINADCDQAALNTLNKGKLLNDDSTDVWLKKSSNKSYETQSLNEKADAVQLKSQTVPPLKVIVKKIWAHCFSLVFIFFVTLGCYPSITASIRPMSQTTSWETLYFTPVCCFLLFSATDWLGRIMAGHIHFPSEKNTKLLLVLVLARTAFFPLFALCNAQPRTTPVVFSHDAYFIIFMTLFGISSGYLSTLSMQYGPKKVEIQHAGTAGSLLAFAIAVGLFSGAGFSFVIKALL